MNIDITTVKEGLIILREVIFVGLFILLLIKPVLIKDKLESAGFIKIDFGFAEWQSEIEKSREEVATARHKANEAERHLSEVSTELRRLSENPRIASSPAFTNRVDQLKLQVDNSTEELRQFDRELERSVQQHDQLIGRIKEAKIK